MSTPGDPRRVGGTYRDSYWRLDYTVLARQINGPWIRIRWLATGEVAEHYTAWDKRDSIISQPADAAHA